LETSYQGDVTQPALGGGFNQNICLMDKNDFINDYHQLCITLMESIAPNKGLSLEEFVEEVKMTTHEWRLCEALLNVYDYM